MYKNGSECSACLIPFKKCTNNFGVIKSCIEHLEDESNVGSKEDCDGEYKESRGGGA